MNSLTLTKNTWIEPDARLDGMSLIDHLFNRLDGTYPHKWRSNFPTEKAIANWRETWADAFVEERVTPQEIKDGLTACRRMYDWPPSLAEFIKACRPSIDPLVAYYEAVEGVQARERGEMGKWSSPAVYWAAIKVSAHDLKNMTYSNIRVRWEAAFKDALLNAHEPIPEPMKALPPPPKAQMTKDEAEKRIAELGATIQVNKPEAAKDSLRWAKRILQRLEDGDKTLQMIQIQYAKEAMGIKA